MPDALNEVLGTVTFKKQENGDLTLAIIKPDGSVDDQKTSPTEFIKIGEVSDNGTYKFYQGFDVSKLGTSVDKSYLLDEIKANNLHDQSIEKSVDILRTYYDDEKLGHELVVKSETVNGKTSYYSDPARVETAELASKKFQEQYMESGKADAILSNMEKSIKSGDADQFTAAQEAYLEMANAWNKGVYARIEGLYQNGKTNDDLTAEQIKKIEAPQIEWAKKQQEMFDRIKQEFPDLVQDVDGMTSVKGNELGHPKAKLKMMEALQEKVAEKVAQERAIQEKIEAEIEEALTEIEAEQAAEEARIEELEKLEVNPDDLKSFDEMTSEEKKGQFTISKDKLFGALHIPEDQQDRIEKDLINPFFEKVEGTDLYQIKIGDDGNIMLGDFYERYAEFWAQSIKEIAKEEDISKHPEKIDALVAKLSDPDASKMHKKMLPEIFTELNRIMESKDKKIDGWEKAAVKSFQKAYKKEQGLDIDARKGLFNIGKKSDYHPDKHDNNDKNDEGVVTRLFSGNKDR